MGGAQAMRRIPRIKFPQRYPKRSDCASQPQEADTAADVDPALLSRSKVVSTAGGKASLQRNERPYPVRRLRRLCWVAASDLVMEL